MKLDYEFYEGNLEVYIKESNLTIPLSELIKHLSHKELAEYLYPYFIAIHANKVFKG